MKCDDDTFVRVDAVIEQAHRVNSQKSVYAGKMNYYHMPLRSGKWAVTYEVLNLSETLSYELVLPLLCILISSSLMV